MPPFGFGRNINVAKMPGWFLLGAALVLLLAPLYGVDAAAYVRGGGGGGVPLPQGDPELIILRKYLIHPFDAVWFDWRMSTDAAGNDVIAGTFNFTGDIYVAVGFSSVKLMQGPIVVCTVNNNVANCDDFVGAIGSADILRAPIQRTSTTSFLGDGNSTAFCIQFSTVIRYVNNASIPAPEPNSQLINIPQGGKYATIEAQGNLTDWAFDVNSTQRSIFAIGTWPNTNPLMPKAHFAGNNIAFSVVWFTGDVQILASNTYRYALGVTGFCVLVGCLIGYFARAGKSLSQTVRKLLSALGIFTFLMCWGLYVALRYYDYKIEKTPKATMRCFGDGAAFLLSAMALPMSKRILFQDHLSVSYERAIRYHTLLGILLLICTGVHGVGMFYFYGFDGVFRWRQKDEYSRLPGPIAFTFIILTVIPALFRHFYYNAWRMAHMSYILVYIFAVLHYPELSIGLAPGAVIHIVGWITGNILVLADRVENLEACFIVDEASGLIQVDISKADYCTPGQWYFIRFPDISAFEQHPFSVAKLQTLKVTAECEKIERRHRMRERAKRREDAEEDPRLKEEWVIKDDEDLDSREIEDDGMDYFLYEMDSHPTLRFFIKISKNPSSWTGRLAQFLRDHNTTTAGEGPPPCPLTSYRLVGPFGCLQHRVVDYSCCVYVAGGIGLTPFLSMLHATVTNDLMITGPMGFKRAIVFVWVVPSLAMADVFAGDLALMLQTIEKSFPWCFARFTTYITNSADPAAFDMMTGVAGSPGRSGGGGAKDQEMLPRGASTGGKRPDTVPSYVHSLKPVKWNQRPNWKELMEELFGLMAAKADDHSGEHEVRDEADAVRAKCNIPKSMHRRVVLYTSGPGSLHGDAGSAASSAASKYKFRFDHDPFEFRL